MILRRLGNKQKIAKEIQKHFPAHNTYIEPFFGAGGMFFNKPVAKYNIVNDLDSDVFNLYQVVINDGLDLIKEIKKMPFHSDLLNYWKNNKETIPIKKALRFLFLSNLVNPMIGDIQRDLLSNSKDILINNAILTMDFINNINIRFFNEDFNLFISRLMKRKCRPIQTEMSFIYCDPPYLSTSNNYSNSFTTEQSVNLFDVLCESKIKFAISEFNNPFILKQAKERNLNIIIIGKRKNLKNKRTEILITNYKTPQLKIF